MGAFGLNERHLDDIVPLDRLVEAHGAISIHDLDRAGLLATGTHALIKSDHGEYDFAVRGPEIVELAGQPIRVSWHRALPLRCWICPRCECDAYKLHSVNGCWACRLCHELSYSSRHRWRTIPKLHRIRALRRRIGADLTPFTQLPVKPLYARKHWAIAREIRLLEQRLIEHGRRDVAQVLENRYAKQP